ncbi:hypothetical protein LJR296_007992 [Cupriavidus necator]|uniref:hypothetical protein n=1 Tax=Cupriavidus necator TaxID=106590 RepID=UPI003ECF6C6A
MNFEEGSYLCYHPETCFECGVLDRPMGHTVRESGDFLQTCRSCGHSWVAVSAEEEEAESKARMEEASEILNPDIRRFMRGKL